MSDSEDDFEIIRFVKKKKSSKESKGETHKPVGEKKFEEDTYSD